MAHSLYARTLTILFSRMGNLIKRFLYIFARFSSHIVYIILECQVQMPHIQQRVSDQSMSWKSWCVSNKEELKLLFDASLPKIIDEQFQIE